MNDTIPERARARLRRRGWVVRKRRNVLVVCHPDDGREVGCVRVGSKGDLSIIHANEADRIALLIALGELDGKAGDIVPRSSEPRAGQSFGEDEIGAMDELFRGLQRGAHPNDLRRLLASEAMRRTVAKFARMKASVQRQRAIGMRLVEGGRR